MLVFPFFHSFVFFILSFLCLLFLFSPSLPSIYPFIFFTFRSPFSRSLNFSYFKIFSSSLFSSSLFSVAHSFCISCFLSFAFLPFSTFFSLLNSLPVLYPISLFAFFPFCHSSFIFSSFLPSFPPFSAGYLFGFFFFFFFFLILFLVGFSPSFFFRFQFAFSFHFLISFVSSLLPNSILIWCALHISLYCELLSLQSIPITCCHLHSLTEPNSIVFTKEKIKRRVRNRYQELAFAVVVAYGLALACLSYLLAFLHELSVMPPILLVSPAYLLHPAGPPILPVFSPLLIAGSYPVSIGL